MEKPRDDNAEMEPRIAAFTSLVERAVQPVMDMRERGHIPIYGGGKLADTGLSIGPSSVRFELYKPEHSELVGYGVGGGVRDVTHATRIQENHAFHGTRQRSAVFCLDKQGVFRRMIAYGGDPLTPARVKRVVDPELADVVIEFFSSPHLNLDKLEVILGLSPEEEASLETQRSHKAKFDAKIAGERLTAAERRRERIRDIHRRNPMARWLRPLGGP